MATLFTRFSKGFIIVFLLIAGLPFSVGILAQTSYESNGSGNWSSTSTWNPTGTPVVGDEVRIINGDVITLDVSIFSTSGLNGLEILDDSQLTGSNPMYINSGYNFEVDGDISVSALTVAGNGAGILGIAAGQTVTTTGKFHILGPIGAPAIPFENHGTISCNDFEVSDYIVENYGFITSSGTMSISGGTDLYVKPTGTISVVGTLTITSPGTLDLQADASNTGFLNSTEQLQEMSIAQQLFTIKNFDRLEIISPVLVVN